jgi:ElaB/YqjD/DUF883 family membrane-anchored ribosome-binding protein
MMRNLIGLTLILVLFSGTAYAVELNIDDYLSLEILGEDGKGDIDGLEVFLDRQATGILKKIDIVIDPAEFQKWYDDSLTLLFKNKKPESVNANDPKTKFNKIRGSGLPVTTDRFYVYTLKQAPFKNNLDDYLVIKSAFKDHSTGVLPLPQFTITYPEWAGGKKTYDFQLTLKRKNGGQRRVEPGILTDEDLAKSVSWTTIKSPVTPFNPSKGEALKIEFEITSKVSQSHAIVMEAKPGDPPIWKLDPKPNPMESSKLIIDNKYRLFTGSKFEGSFSCKATALDGKDQVELVRRYWFVPTGKVEQINTKADLDSHGKDFSFQPITYKIQKPEDTTGSGTPVGTTNGANGNGTKTGWKDHLNSWSGRLDILILATLLIGFVRRKGVKRTQVWIQSLRGGRKAQKAAVDRLIDTVNKFEQRILPSGQPVAPAESGEVEAQPTGQSYATPPQDDAPLANHQLTALIREFGERLRGLEGQIADLGNLNPRIGNLSQRVEALPGRFSRQLDERLSQGATDRKTEIDQLRSDISKIQTDMDKMPKELSETIDKKLAELTQEREGKLEGLRSDLEGQVQGVSEKITKTENTLGETQERLETLFPDPDAYQCPETIRPYVEAIVRELGTFTIMLRSAPDDQLEEALELSRHQLTQLLDKQPKVTALTQLLKPYQSDPAQSMSIILKHVFDTNGTGKHLGRFFASLNANHPTYLTAAQNAFSKIGLQAYLIEANSSLDAQGIDLEELKGLKAVTLDDPKATGADIVKIVGQIPVVYHNPFSNRKELVQGGNVNYKEKNNQNASA